MGNVDIATVQHNGLTFRIELDHDSDIDVRSDGDWASGADVALWIADEWQYVTVSIYIESDDLWSGLPVFDLGAVTYGEGDGWTTNTADIVERAKTEGWLDEAVTALREHLARVPAVVESIAAKLTAYTPSAERPALPAPTT